MSLWYKGPTLYLVSIRLVIVIVISAMFTFYSVQSYRINIAETYDYDRENLIQSPSLNHVKYKV